MKKILFLSLLFVFCFALNAYAVPPYKIDDSASKDLNAPSPVLKRTDKILIVLPEDGQYGDKVYPGSGSLTADRLYVALSKRANDVTVSDTDMTMEEAKAYARKNNFTHIIYPEITNWEERLTSVSGRRSNLSIHVTVFDVSNNKMVHDAILYGYGPSSWTVGVVGQKSMDSLLDKPAVAYATLLFTGNK